eukprot:18904-Heterococcus_DN1.PRE.1
MSGVLIQHCILCTPCVRFNRRRGTCAQALADVRTGSTCSAVQATMWCSSDRHVLRHLVHPAHRTHYEHHDVTDLKRLYEAARTLAVMRVPAMSDREMLEELCAALTADADATSGTASAATTASDALLLLLLL